MTDLDVVNIEFSHWNKDNFINTTKKLYKFYNLEYKIKKNKSWYQNLKTYQVSMNNFNFDDKFNKVQNDIVLMSFDNFFIKIAIVDCDFTLENFNNVIHKLLNNYEICNNKDKYKNVSAYLNSIYPLTNFSIDNFDIEVIGSNRISFYTNEFLSKIIKKFPDNIISQGGGYFYLFDYDKIKKDFDVFFNTINKYGLKYNTEFYRNGIFLSVTNSLMIENNKIIEKGIYGGNIRTKDDYIKAQNDLNRIIRQNKLKEIL